LKRTAANEYLEAEYLPEHNRRFAQEAARPENYHLRAPSPAKLREVFRLETERWISNDWVVQYRGHFLQLKPQNKRYGPTAQGFAPADTPTTTANQKKKGRF
jgi:hypothetical protein